MAIAVVGTVPRPIDHDLVRVGYTVSGQKAQLIGDLVNHQHGWRRRTGLGAVYQRDQGNTTRGAPPHGPDDEHSWTYLVSQNCTHVRVTALTQGATASSPVAALRVITDTDAVGVLMNQVAQRAAPAGDAQVTGVEQHEAIIEVTPGSVQRVRVVQENASSLVRILAIAIQEMPITRLDTAAHNGVYFTSFNRAGIEVAMGDYDDVPIAVQNLRTQHKKILNQNGKLVSTDSLTFVDLYTKSLTDRLHWQANVSPWLPETVNPAVGVTLQILAQSVGAINSQFRVAWIGAGTTSTVTLTNTLLQVWTLAASVNRAGDKFSIQGLRDGAATRLDVYDWVLYENAEVA